MKRELKLLPLPLGEGWGEGKRSTKMFEVDLKKFKKYDKPGPRYTSYPTAPQFNEQFTHADFVDEIVKTNYEKNLPDLSLYFHIPYCDTLFFLRMQYACYKKSR